MLRINYDDLESDSDGIYYLDGKPFTGTAYELYPNGQVSSEVEMIEGIANGAVHEWYPSGKPKLEGYGKIGERYSWSHEWFENGNPKHELVCEFHARAKERTWNEQGQLIFEYNHSSSDKG
jgi:antitoxin component YwqK of YwqJK toxin-antitoxin module